MLRKHNTHTHNIIMKTHTKNNMFYPKLQYGTTLLMKSSGKAATNTFSHTQQNLAHLFHMSITWSAGH